MQEAQVWSLVRERRFHMLCGAAKKSDRKNDFPCIYFYIIWLFIMCIHDFHKVRSNEIEIQRNLYAVQEATVKTGHGTTDWFQIGKGVHQGCILSPCLSNLYAEYIMRNARLDEAPAGIKIAGRNINNLRYADDTTLMAESEEELNSLLMKVKEESEKAGLKLNIQKTKIMARGPITSWQRWWINENSDRLYFLGLQNHCRWWLQPWN